MKNVLEISLLCFNKKTKVSRKGKPMKKEARKKIC